MISSRSNPKENNSTINIERNEKRRRTDSSLYPSSPGLMSFSQAKIDIEDNIPSMYLNKSSDEEDSQINDTLAY